MSFWTFFGDEWLRWKDFTIVHKFKNGNVRLKVEAFTGRAHTFYATPFEHDGKTDYIEVGHVKRWVEDHI